MCITGGVQCALCLMAVPAAGRLVAQCVLLSVAQMEQRREEAAEAEQPRHRLTVHISREDRHSVSHQHSLSSSGNKTSGAGLVPLSGILDYQIIPRTWFALYSPGRHLTHRARRIYKLFTVAQAEILEDGFSPGDICPYFGHCGSSAGLLH